MELSALTMGKVQDFLETIPSEHGRIIYKVLKSLSSGMVTA